MEVIGFTVSLVNTIITSIKPKGKKGGNIVVKGALSSALE